MSILLKIFIIIIFIVIPGFHFKEQFSKRPLLTVSAFLMGIVLLYNSFLPLEKVIISEKNISNELVGSSPAINTAKVKASKSDEKNKNNALSTNQRHIVINESGISQIGYTDNGVQVGFYLSYYPDTKTIYLSYFDKHGSEEYTESIDNYIKPIKRFIDYPYVETYQEDIFSLLKILNEKQDPPSNIINKYVKLGYN